MSTLAEPDAVHVFDNGIKVRRRHLIPAQVERYAAGENLHEPEEERLFVALVRECDGPGLFLDVGSAVGYYAILTKKTSPALRIHAFEPYSQHRRYLAENLELNGLDAAAVTLHAEAVGAAAGRSEFRIHHYGSSLVAGGSRPALSMRNRVARLMSRWGLRAMPERHGETVEVPVITLDDFLRRHGPAELIKVDVQGFETDVLRGATASLTSRSVARWLIGTHGAPIHRECIAILEQHGYEIEVDQQQVPGQPDGVIVARAE